MLELRPLYTQDTDYDIVESGVQLKSSLINSTTQTLYITKDPSDRIQPLGINPELYQPDEVSSWKLKLNPGSLLIRSGIYNNEQERFYLLENNYSHDCYAVTNVKPLTISDNILHVEQYPIYLDETDYKYPLYTINVYDKTASEVTTNKGNISIDINGTTRTDIKILSVDRKKGYLQLNTSLNPSDEVELCFYVDNNYYLIVDNLELNPKVDAGLLYNITDFPSGLGIALKEYVDNYYQDYI